MSSQRRRILFVGAAVLCLALGSAAASFATNALARQHGLQQRLQMRTFIHRSVTSPLLLRSVFIKEAR